MSVVRRRLIPLLALLAVLAGCGGSSSGSNADDLRASARNLTSVRFDILIHANVAGLKVQTEENGTVSFLLRRAHVYRLAPGQSSTPQELIYDGDTVYSNANLLAALGDPSQKPWVRQARIASHIDDVDHVRALALLAAGTVDVTHVGKNHYRAQVQPDRLGTRLARVVRADYVATAFPADFWLDDAGRVARVRVAYTTPKGGTIVVVGTFTDYGTKVDVTPPPKDSTAVAAAATH
jgi:hypothetical protein